MEKRIKIYETEPQAFKAMFGLEGYLAKAEISKTLKELIKIRASQINNCAYCIDLHTKEAVKNGINPEKIFIISAWKEAAPFSPKKNRPCSQ